MHIFVGVVHFALHHIFVLLIQHPCPLNSLMSVHRICQSLEGLRVSTRFGAKWREDSKTKEDELPSPAAPNGRSRKPAASWQNLTCLEVLDMIKGSPRDRYLHFFSLSPRRRVVADSRQICGQAAQNTVRPKSSGSHSGPSQWPPGCSQTIFQAFSNYSPHGSFRD